MGHGNKNKKQTVYSGFTYAVVSTASCKMDHESGEVFLIRSRITFAAIVYMINSGWLADINFKGI